MSNQKLFETIKVAIEAGHFMDKTETVRDMQAKLVLEALSKYILECKEQHHDKR